MSWLEVKTDKIVSNINKLSDYLEEYDVKWTLVSKVLSGNRDILEKIMTFPTLNRIHSIGDSRLSNLKVIKSIDPDIVTMYIKPPAVRYIKDVVRYADISLNSSLETVRALNEEAKNQNRVHRIIIMVEMGELREGVIGNKVLEFYEEIFELSNVDVEGIGTNLGCMYGIEPTLDKLTQLALYKQFLQAKFGRDIPLISAGSSITLPLASNKGFPKSTNHFRVGEAIFLGTTPMTGKKFKKLSTDVFKFYGNIVELKKKDMIPSGNSGEGSVGTTAGTDKYERGDKSYRAILDFGVLDVDMKELEPVSEHVNFVGTTSDMTVYDLGKNKTKSGKERFKVGGRIAFKPNYIAVARLMNSRFIEKRII